VGDRPYVFTKYSLFDRTAEAEILPLAQRDGIVIVYSPMGSSSPART
jgi:aryl-alcohol dehydrogenase-like predicted oxidoreductase